MKCRLLISPRTVSVLLPAVMITLAGLITAGCGAKPESIPAGDALPPEAGVPDSGTGPGPAAESLPKAALPATGGTAEEVLARMIRAYKSAASYRDAAVVQASGMHAGQREERLFPCAVAMERPNKIRMEVDNGTLLCDGVSTYGFVRDFPDQVLKIPAPAGLSIESLYPDFLLGTAMMQSPAQTFSWVPLQVVLLLADDPMKTLALGTQELALIAPAMIEQDVCDRIQLVTGNGVGVLWIDQATSALRRFELPADAFRRDAAEQQYADVSLVVEFRDVQLNSPIAPEAFTFQLPAGIATVDALALPLLQILGERCPDFQLTDLEEKTTALSSLEGKVVVMELWTTTSAACRPVLQAASSAYGELESKEDVVVMAVNLDGPNVQDSSLQAVLKDWDVDLPIFRDREQAIARHFRISDVPLTIILGKKGDIQSFQPGQLEGMDVLLARTIERLQGGEDVFRSAFQQFEANRAQFDLMVKQGVAEDVYCLLPAIPRAEVSQRTEPANLKMTKLWSCDQLKEPGNITVVSSPDGPPRILVLDGRNSVAELTSDGEVREIRTLQLEGNEVVTVLRTATADDGERYFLGTARGVQRVHVFDQDLKTILVYPDSQHPGIGDAQFADLDGDGTPEILVGYFDVAGVQASGLKGNRLWANRSMANALRVAALAPGGDGHRNVLAMNGGPGGGTLVELDWQGTRVREISVPDRSIGWLVADDLDDDGTSEICVLAQVVTPEGQGVPGEVVQMGINLDGDALWQHPLPAGVHFQQIEPVTSGNVYPAGARQWLIASADGTITVVAIDGRVVERFAYGAELAGLATAQWDGKAILLVATTGAVEAWQVDSSPTSSAPLLSPASN